MSFLRILLAAALLLQAAVALNLRSVFFGERQLQKEPRRRLSQVADTDADEGDDYEYEGCFCACDLWYAHEEGTGVIMYATDEALVDENGGVSTVTILIL